MTKIHIIQIQMLHNDGFGHNKDVEEEDFEDPEKLGYHESVTKEKVKQRSSSQDECKSNGSDGEEEVEVNYLRSEGKRMEA